MLTETMRPATLSQVIGQKLVVEALRKQMTTRPAHAIMFHGPPGTGKTSLSRIVAISLQCDHQQVWGDPCKECQEASFDIHEVNASEANGVEDAAQLVERARYRPTFGKYRVLILSEAQRLTSQAQQLLLKPTEEPPHEERYGLLTLANPPRLTQRYVAGSSLTSSSPLRYKVQRRYFSVRLSA